MRSLWWSTDGHELEREEARVRGEAVERAIAAYDRHLRAIGLRDGDGMPVEPATRSGR